MNHPNHYQNPRHFLWKKSSLPHLNNSPPSQVSPGGVMSQPLFWQKAGFICILMLRGLRRKMSDTHSPSSSSFFSFIFPSIFLHFCFIFPRNVLHFCFYSPQHFYTSASYYPKKVLHFCFIFPWQFLHLCFDPTQTLLNQFVLCLNIFVVAILYNSNLIMKQVLLFLEATLWIEAQSFEAKISIKDKDRGDKSLLYGEMMP